MLIGEIAFSLVKAKLGNVWNYCGGYLWAYLKRSISGNRGNQAVVLFLFNPLPGKSLLNCNYEYRQEQRLALFRGSALYCAVGGCNSAKQPIVSPNDQCSGARHRRQPTRNKRKCVNGNCSETALQNALAARDLAVARCNPTPVFSALKLPHCRASIHLLWRENTLKIPVMTIDIQNKHSCARGDYRQIDHLEISSITYGDYGGRHYLTDQQALAIYVARKVLRHNCQPSDGAELYFHYVDLCGVVGQPRQPVLDRAGDDYCAKQSAAGQPAFISGVSPQFLTAQVNARLL